jgi:hypothetical protein
MHNRMKLETFKDSQGRMDWEEFNSSGNYGFWNGIRFFAEVKIGDYIPAWFTDNYHGTRDEGGWWFLAKLCLLAFTAIIFAGFFCLFLALHHVEGWITIGCILGVVGIFFVVPLAWQMIFKVSDKAQDVQETIAKLEDAVAVAVVVAEEGVDVALDDLPDVPHKDSAS